ncbi:MAG: response regulator, partial [Myxococcota bacterium]
AINRSVLSQMVGLRGFNTTCVNRGASALDAIERGGFDLVLLDLHMPDLDGLAILRQVRRILSPSELPIYIVSADARPEVGLACLAAGAQGVLLKPLDRAALDAALMVHIPMAQESAS